ncbi:MAG: ScaI family restriction endonuclease [Oscillospiraceae bacterium]|nr:ScaI family restriction endonuclease [Oscillospiraceae bacterium]
MDPYKDKKIESWLSITEHLVSIHPLTPVIPDLCLRSWQSLLNGKINTYLNLKIKEMNLSPQATSALLHDVITEYVEKNVNGFRKGIGSEKDIVCEYDDSFSIELKTSSSDKNIFGNRSYAKSDSGKSKSGYYLAVNYEKVSSPNPVIKLIQIGWLDHSDWKGQKSETGQQASLTKEARNNKLIVLYKPGVPEI